MSKFKNDKIDLILNTGKLPDDFNEAKEILNQLYSLVSTLTDTIEKKSSELSNIYRYNLKQNRVDYEYNNEINNQSKKVDVLVNEYNNIIIMIELLEKKLSELDN